MTPAANHDGGTEPLINSSCSINACTPTRRRFLNRRVRPIDIERFIHRSPFLLQESRSSRDEVSRAT